MRRPLLVIAFCLAAGALAGIEMAAGAAWAVLALSAVALASSLAAGGRAALAAVSVAAFGIGAAGAAAEGRRYRAAPLAAWVEAGHASEVPVALTGVVRRDVPDDGERTMLLLDVETATAGGRDVVLRGRARIEVGGEARARAPLRLGEGERVRVWARLRPPRGLSSPGAPDRAGQARAEGVHAFGYCKSRLLVEPVAGAPDGWLGLPARCRQRARERLRAVVLPGPEQAVVRAMALGERAALDEETLESFRAAGTYHVLALSGAQVAMVAALVLWVLRRFRLPPLAQAAAVCLALGFYARLVGGDVPVTRAAFMAMVLAAGHCLDLDGDLANLLGLAGAVLLVGRPSAILDPSFQLSFAATLGVLLLTPVLARGVPRLPLRLDLALTASLAALLALAPLLVAHFHRLALAALVLNLVAGPLSGATLLLGAAAAAAPAAGGAATAAGDLAWMSAHALLRSAEAARWWPALDLRPPSMPPLAVVVYAAGLLALVAGRRRGGLGVMALAALLTAVQPAPADGRLHVAVLDVGQGDAIGLRTPNGRFFLVDAGDERQRGFDAGETVVAPWLWRERARRIDAAVLTHAHPDHAGGLAFLLRAFRVGEVWEGKAPRTDPGYERLRGVLRGTEARRLVVARGALADWDGVEVAVLGPPAGPPPGRTRNDDSVVLRLRLGEVRFLLTGDIEARAEEALGPVRAEVVKVAHHGSRSSSAAGFVAGVGARAAVFSAGARNPFGHPHPEVVERWRRAGAFVLRTDRDGAVTFSTDGRRLWVRTHRHGGEWRLK